MNIYMKTSRQYFSRAEREAMKAKKTKTSHLEGYIKSELLRLNLLGHEEIESNRIKQLKAKLRTLEAGVNPLAL